MNNKYIALIVAILTTITAHAGDTNVATADKVVLTTINQPVGFEVEPHWTGEWVRTRSGGQWSPYTWNNEEAVSFSADFHNNWDLELETGVDTSTATVPAQIGGYTEFKLRHTWHLSPKWEFGIQGGLGDTYTYNSAGPNIPYWMSQIRIKYHLTDKLRLRAQYEPQNAINSQYNVFQNTAKVGIEYDLTEHDEFGIRYVNQFGGTVQGNGLEVLLAHSF